MIKPHKLMLPVRSSRFFLTVFLVVLMVAVFRVPALEGENDSDIIVIFSDSLDKEAVLPRGLDSTIPSEVMLTVEPSPKTVTVSTTFDIEIWLRNVQQPINDYGVFLKILGLDDLVELIDISIADPNFPITHDVRVATIRLHCLSVGIVKVDVSRPDNYVIIDSTRFGVTGVDGFIHQIEPPVGGITIPTNKLAILSPYLSLAGLISVVSAFYVIKRRKD